MKGWTDIILEAMGDFEYKNPGALEELKLENEPIKIITAEEKAIIKHKKKIRQKKKRLKEQFKY